MTNVRLPVVALISLFVSTTTGCTSAEQDGHLSVSRQGTLDYNWVASDRMGVDGMRMSSQQMMLIKRTYAAVDMLFSRSHAVIDKKRPILVASLVSVKSLTETSPLGLIMSEQISGRSVQLGYRVHEIKLRDSISLNLQAGEFALSRDLSVLRTQHDAQAVLSGTYAVGESIVHVNLKLTELVTARVLSSVDFVVPADRWQDRDIRSLVGQP